MPKYWGKQIFSLGRFPKVGQKQKMEREREKKRDRKLVITMTSYALQRHLGWRTQSRLGQQTIGVSLPSIRHNKLILLVVKEAVTIWTSCSSQARIRLLNLWKLSLYFEYNYLIRSLAYLPSLWITPNTTSVRIFPLLPTRICVSIFTMGNAVYAYGFFL